VAGIGSGEPRIRVAQVEDIDALTQMWEKLENYHANLGGPEYRLARGWKGTWRRFARSHIGHKDRLCLVAELDGTAVGFLMGAVLTRPSVFEHRSYGHIYDLFVDPAQRNRGVGESLVVEALAWFRSRRVEKVDLYTHARNEMGIRFWKKMGFEATAHILDRRM
jgi:ribosomal protein S18 acetylase RimI-like enzyme